MSMSTHVTGIIPPDEKWKKMKAAWDACNAADVTPPKDVLAFFNGETPDDAGVLLDLEHCEQPTPLGVPKKRGLHPCLEEWRAEGRQGYEVDLTKVPPHVKKIRFYNSW